MFQNPKYFHRSTRFRASVAAVVMVALGACNDRDPLAPDAQPTSGAELGSAPEIATTPAIGPEFSTRFAGGIAMGTFSLPTSWFGSRYNGVSRTISPSYVLSELSSIRSRGGKIILNMAGSPNYYTDAAGNFSLTKWKQRVDRFRGVNLGSYISDGTIIGHYLIDEPNDPTNWNGRQVSASTVDEMARYSKQLWSGMPTIVRTEPGYFSSSPRYVDAAWAQYLYRRGNVSDYIRKQVSDAQHRGLALVVGLNVLKGGNPNGSQMSGTEVKSWGSTLLSSSYPCAFISWNYSSSYLNQNSIEDAMSYLRNKAQSRSTKSCRS
ncbi:MAG TPA: hypothetical protein VF046_08905 [Gemmatimonadales bacterium]|jgi:hypothetical protein